MDNRDAQGGSDAAGNGPAAEGVDEAVRAAADPPLILSPSPAGLPPAGPPRVSSQRSIDMNRRSAIQLLGAAVATPLWPGHARLQQSAPSRNPPTFEQGAIIRTLLNDLPPQALAS